MADIQALFDEVSRLTQDEAKQLSDMLKANMPKKETEAEEADSPETESEGSES